MKTKLIYHPAPEYPESAKATGLEGSVKLNALIGEDGRVHDITTISGEAILVDAARRAVMQWRYHPILLNGQAVQVLTEVVVNFQLTGDNLVHSTALVAPVPTYHPDPPYTDKARKARLEGTVVLSVGVDAQGNVVDVKEVGKKLGDGLDKSALQTVRSWKFKPAMKQGAPMPIHVAVDLNFHLPSEDDAKSKPL